MSRWTERGPLRDMRHFARKAIEVSRTASADELEVPRIMDVRHR